MNALTISKRGEHIIMVLLLLLQAGMALAIGISRFAPLLEPDTGSYLEPAKHLLQSGFFSENGTSPMYFRVQGYSVFIALFLALFHSLTPVWIAQIFLNAITAILVYKTVSVYCNDNKLPLLAMAVFCFDLCSNIYTACLLTETISAFLLTSSLYYFSVWLQDTCKPVPFALTTAGIMGVLLIKPAIMYLCYIMFFTVLILAIVKKIHWKIAAIYMVSFLLLWGGWSFRNYLHSGHFVYSSIRNVQFFYWDARILKADIENISQAEADSFFDNALNEELAGYTGLNEIEVGLLQKKIGNAYIKANFPDYIKMNVKGLFNLLLGPGKTDINLLFKYPVNMAVMVLYMGLLGLIYGLYAVGFLLNIKSIRIFDWVLLLAIGYFSAGHASLGYSRYRVLFTGLIIVGAALVWRSRFNYNTKSCTDK